MKRASYEPIAMRAEMRVLSHAPSEGAACKLSGAASTLLNLIHGIAHVD